MTGIAAGLLVLRIGLAALLVGHATQKLFGWFQGNGLAKTATIFESWGFRPGQRMAVIAAGCELLGAGSIALGLLTPGGCTVVVGTMIVAASPNAANGLWAHRGGCEVPVLYGFMAAVLAFTGPGRYSLDNVAGLTDLHGVGYGIGAVLLGAVAATVPLYQRHRVLTSAVGQ
jgi:putative oxidoreductase